MDKRTGGEKAKSKYCLGELLYSIWQFKKAIHYDCPMCDRKCRIEINGISKMCPHCHGNGFLVRREDTKWNVSDDAFIAKNVRVAFTDEDDSPKVEYMNGRSSGSVYREPNCFKTRAEAQAECDTRNEAEAND